MPKISAPNSGADRRAVAAGQQRAADHGGDDRLELLLGAAQRVGRAGREHLDRGEQRRPRSAVRTNSMILIRATGTPTLRAAFGIAAAGEDPVAEPGPREHPGGDRGERRSTRGSTSECPARSAARRRACRSCRCSASQAISGLRRTGRRRTAPASRCAASSCRPETWVRPVISRVRPSVRPRSMNRLPSVTMKDGSPVFTTSRPLR